ncbi:glutathionylspermidine synthase-like protein [Azotobacter chroococcum]|uniref:Glutathionylspermidine synthase-like protein n=1 Tax=Azotobacter chroococcum TaxID=353 RepID=A0A4R1PTZ8_9GAMM|nr:glutathionylspermidine synthase-like protein [Azotobacter chroococcum]
MAAPRTAPLRAAGPGLRRPGPGQTKLLELNYDTPTALYEAAFFQWLWLEQLRLSGELPAAADQFNSIQECLFERFAGLAVQQPLYFASVRDSREDRGTIDYLRDIATPAGHDARHIAIEDIGLDRAGGFVDLDERHIPTLFKLYPWEFLLEEDFGPRIAGAFTRFIEPPWTACAFAYPAPTAAPRCTRPAPAALLRRPAPGDRQLGGGRPRLRHRHPRGRQPDHPGQLALPAAFHPRLSAALARPRRAGRLSHGLRRSAAF